MKWVLALLLATPVMANDKPCHPIWDVKQTAMNVLWDRLLIVHPPVVSKPDPTLINGTVPDMRDFPATAFTGSCTTTAVGDRVLKIAAHCVSNGRSISAPVGGTKYTGVCTHSADYRGNSTADYSLCFTSKPMVGVEFETVNLDPKYLDVGDKVMLGGYGCTDPGGNGGIDGKFRIGLAEITKMPSGTNNDIVTGNGAALCYGDSGGAAWGLRPDGSRGKLISVNSRGNIRTISYLSATHTVQFKKFIDSWTAANPEARICGYHADAKNCRGEEPSVPENFKVGKYDITVRPGGELKAANVKSTFEAGVK